MSKAPESSEPNSSVGQHGDPNTLDVFAELKKSGVKSDAEPTDPAPASQKTPKESHGTTDGTSPAPKSDVNRPDAKQESAEIGRAHV